MPNTKQIAPIDFGKLWWLLAAAILIGSWGAILLDAPIFALFPAVLFGIYVTIVDYKKLYYLLFFSIPFSFNFGIGSSSIDLPSEPITILLAGISVIYFLANYRKMSYKFITHPVSLLLFLHLGWIFITTLTSEQFSFSVKFLAAKIWYILPFYFLAAKLLYRDKVYKIWLFSTLIGISLTIVYVMIRHSAFGFSFDDINWVLGPFYPNHVIYASVLTLFLPYIWESLAFFKRKSAYWWLMIGLILLFLVAIKYSYTRTAYISVVALIGSYWLIRFNLLKYALIAAVIVSSLGVRWIIQDNHYLDFTPNFERTISNKEFDDLVEATYNLEDISVMERVYRWVAAFRMTSDHPYLGFGPGNFYSFYQPYTLRMFKTYVSDNPEKSGVHCYFLMTAVEQGIPGMIIFILLMLSIIVTGERAYHLAKDPKIKRRIMANLLTFLAVCSLLIVNDMIETDKIGSFFFVSAALIVRFYIHAKDSGLTPKNEQALSPTKS